MNLLLKIKKQFYARKRHERKPIQRHRHQNANCSLDHLCGFLSNSGIRTKWDKEYEEKTVLSIIKDQSNDRTVRR